MDKESILELQKIDCNCNDCIFMQRNLERFKESQAFQHKMQFDYFIVIRQKLIDRAKFYKNKFYDLEMWDKLLTQAEKMKFQFDGKQSNINYGDCSKFNIPVTFIPNTVQLHTQKCFKHRKNE